MMYLQVTLLVSMVILCCHGDDTDSISHLVLLDDYPATLTPGVHPQLEIRTNYSGSIEFHEAEEFKVLLNITAPSIQNAYGVAAELIDHKGKLLLQVYEKKASGLPVSLQWIIIVIGIFTGIVFFISLTYVVYWYHSKKHLDYYQGYLGDSRAWRSRNSMQLGAAAEQLLGDPDQHDEDVIDGEDDGERERRKMEKLRVSLKPETIMEESEDSTDDDRTNLKSRFQLSNRHLNRQFSFKKNENALGNANLNGSGLLDYPNQSDDEGNDNNLSPDQKIADADGSYTPLDEVDDLHDSDMKNSQSTAKLHDPRGNLDYNIQTSHSEGDLLGGGPKKVSEKEKEIAPLKVAVPSKKKSPLKEVPVRRRAEPNIYERGLNLKPQDLNLRIPQNDLSFDQSARTRAQVHSPENPYVNNSHGQYVALMQTPSDQSSRSRISRESNDAYDSFTYSADIPLSTFKGPERSPSKEASKSKPIPKPKPKPKPMFTSGSPNAFDFNKLEPKFVLDHAHEPISPGNFSMLSENTDSDSLSDADDLIDQNDSDLDIPPPNDEGGEVLSNDSLPLPSPPPMENQFFDDNRPPMLQLSPRQSLIHPEDEDRYGTVIALTGSPSPGGPYSKHSVNQAEPRFVFPPPPMMYNPPQHGAWARRELDFGDEGEYVEPRITQLARKGDYVEPRVLQTSRGAEGMDPRGAQGQRKKDETKGGKERKMSGGSRKGGGKPPKHLHLTMLTTLTVLSVMSGVYCLTNNPETKVNIVVYVPPSFPYKNSTIYTGVDKMVHLHKYDGMKWLSAENPILYNFNSTWCSNRRCLHGCDDNTGQCICNHGYIMKKGECIDLNECQNGMARCSHPQSGCANYPGSYDCLCLARYKLYNFNDKCLDCAVDCEKGTYEVRPCIGDSPKVCKECTKSCGENYYMKQRCTNKTDAACRICDPRCNGTNNEYEFTQCSAYQNRACKDKSTLPAPLLSSNIILDDLTAVGEEFSNIPYHSLDSSGVTIKLRKDSTGLGAESWIELEIKYFKPISKFSSVNHSDAMLDSDLIGHKHILAQCAYPVPRMYNLTYIKHMGVSYKGDASLGSDGIDRCEGDPNSFPYIENTKERSVLCTEPGPLIDVFQNLRSENYEQTETTWQERSDVCAQRHQACENCSRNCAQEMPQNNDECQVKATDENDRSPRLPLCLSCCATENCKDKCQNYHDSRCKVGRCTKGNLAQFELRPVYPTGDVFLCHVEPILGQQLVKVQYTVVYWHQRERKTFVRELVVNSDELWQKTGKTAKKDDIIEIVINSHLTEIPDFIQSAWGGQDVQVGKYQAVGRRLVNTAASANYVFVRPDIPFGVNPKQFGKQKCQDMSLKNVVMATLDGQPIRVIPDLVAVQEDGQRGSYLIFNRTKMPVMGVRLNKNTSILRAVYHPKKMVLGSLAGSMLFNGTHWLVTITALMEDCPGFLSLNISDASYPDTQLYQFHLGYECPNELNMTVMIPTGDSPLLSKNVQVRVRDVDTIYVLTIHAPAQITEEQLDRQVPPAPPTGSSKTEEYSSEVSTLFVAIVFGVILLLVAMLVFGVAWKQGIPEGNIQRFHIRHLVLLVIYITFQFLYAAFVTMSVFVLVIIAVNGEKTTFLKQYNQQRSVTAALSRLELEDMDFHLQNELLRQKNEASDRKFKCQQNIKGIIDNVQKVVTTLDAQSINTMQKKNLSELVISHTKSTVEKFSQDFVTFRDEYRKYSTYIVNKLYNEVETTINSIEDSKWLVGAQFIYNFVSINKKLHGGSNVMMPFMEWVDMDTDILRKFDDVRVDLPDLPVLGDRLDTVGAGIQPKPRLEPISSQTINQWFIQPSIETRNQNMTGHSQTSNKSKRVTSLDPSSYKVFVVAMVIIDILWILHRMVKACGIGKLLLYGYPIYVDVREQKDGSEEKKKLNKTPKLKMVKNVMRKILSTLFIPKLIATLFICLLLLVVSLTSDNFINRKTFNYLGYYNDMDEVLHINELVINSRIGSHADRINRLEFPMYEDAMNDNLENHQYVLNMLETQWHGIMESHAKMYCNYLRKINETADCEEIYALTDLKLDGCIFNPVIPKFYQRNVKTRYEDAMNDNLENHQYVLNMLETQWHGIMESHAKMYCNYLRKINETADCEEIYALTDLKLDGCIFNPVIPKFYQRNVKTMFEEAMTNNLENHQYVLNMLETQWHGIMESHAKMYCNYLRKINKTADCEEIYALTDLKLDGCIFNPVIPKFYQRVVTSSSQIASEQLDAFLKMIRDLIADTTNVIKIYMAAIIIKELFGTVLWIYMKRSGFVSLRIIYETDEAPGSADSSTTNK